MQFIFWLETMQAPENLNAEGWHLAALLSSSSLMFSLKKIVGLSPRFGMSLKAKYLGFGIQK